MLGDGCEGAVEGGEGSLEEAEGFHDGDVMWFWCDVVALSSVVRTRGHASGI